MKQLVGLMEWFKPYGKVKIHSTKTGFINDMLYFYFCMLLMNLTINKAFMWCKYSVVNSEEKFIRFDHCLLYDSRLSLVCIFGATANNYAANNQGIFPSLVLIINWLLAVDP